MRTITKILSVCLMACVFFSFTKENVDIEQQAYELHIKQGMKKILAQVDPKVNVGITVLSLKDGKVLYEKNQDRLLIPASTTKLFTAYAALGLLGTNYQFTTEFLSNTKLEKILPGNLYVKGSGDPTFSGGDLVAMVMHLRALGIETIQGDVVLDSTVFDDIYDAPGIIRFDDDYEGLWDSKVSGLSLDHNCVDLWVSPTKVSEPPSVVVVPEIALTNFSNLAKTVERGHDLHIFRRTSMELKGEIGMDQKQKRFFLPVEEPPEFFGKVLFNLLQNKGIKIEGKLSYGKAPEKYERLAVHSSASLPILMIHMMKETDNLYADSLFKIIGYKGEGLGSWQSGKRACRDFIRKNTSLNIDDITIFDGSGLSHANKATSKQMAMFLQEMYNDLRIFPEFAASLPIGGIDGTLKKRMKGPSGNRIRAKSGSLTGVSSLAGYIRTKGGDNLAFAIIANGVEGSSWEFKTEVEDEIALFLAELKKEK